MLVVIWKIMTFNSSVRNVVNVKIALPVLIVIMLKNLILSQWMHCVHIISQMGLLNSAHYLEEEIRMSVLDVSMATKKYKKKVAIENVTFIVKQGDILAYLGPNGSGKTTTIKSILGQLELNAGTISVLGVNIAKNYDALYGKVCALFDENGLYERLTGKENICFFLNACGKQNLISEAIELLHEMDLSDELQQRVSTYSKGMKRKLALARSLAIQPELLLLDEPFDGIDIESRSKIIKVIKRYNVEHHTTIIMTSHVMADIEDLATQIIIIKKGHIIVNESILDFAERTGNTLSDKYLEVINNEEASMG